MTTSTCSNCHRQGHKYTSCVQPLRPELEVRKSKHKSNRSMPEEGRKEAAPAQAQPASADAPSQAHVTPPAQAAPAPSPAPVARPQAQVQAPTAPVPAQAPASSGRAKLSSVRGRGSYRGRRSRGGMLMCYFIASGSQ